MVAQADAIGMTLPKYRRLLASTFREIDLLVLKALHVETGDRGDELEREIARDRPTAPAAVGSSPASASAAQRKSAPSSVAVPGRSPEHSASQTRRAVPTSQKPTKRRKNVRLPSEVAEVIVERAGSMGLTLTAYMRLLASQFDEIDLLVLRALHVTTGERLEERERELRGRAAGSSSARDSGGPADAGSPAAAAPVSRQSAASSTPASSRAVEHPPAQPRRPVPPAQKPVPHGARS